MDAKFRYFLEHCNFQIASLSIRCLTYDKSKHGLSFNSARLKDELYLYKFLEKTQKPSIISALYPLIYGNKNLYFGYEEAVKLYIAIRKKISSVEQYAIFLLCNLIKTQYVNKDYIINYNIENMSKEDAVNLQKAKISSIMKHEKIIELVYEYLNEDSSYIGILNSDNTDIDFKEDKYKSVLCTYYTELMEGRVSSRKYESYNLDVIENAFLMKKGENISCSLFPQATISDTINKNNEITVIIETKNTNYKICKRL